MRILVVGGGSGGHVTPVIAVLKEIFKLQPKADVRMWCDKRFQGQARLSLGSLSQPVRLYVIPAGKFRRYHHLTFLQHFTMPSLIWRNFVDLFKILGGLLLSLLKLLRWRPDVIFAKGGYVSLPVGIAGHLLGIPLVIHDSDVHPGLTNRVLSRWAKYIGTGAPLEYYSYPTTKARYVGIPIKDSYQKVNKKGADKLKQEWGFGTRLPLVVVTGGGLGAKRLNLVTLTALEDLNKFSSVALIAGEDHFDELRQKYPKDTSKFKLYSFINNIEELLKASDIVVTRAGATAILEVAALEKPMILVPNEALTGGHQVKNAQVYGEAGAAIVLNEDELVDNPELLVEAVKSYLDDKKVASAMANRLSKFARLSAARDMADLILKAGRDSQ